MGFGKTEKVKLPAKTFDLDEDGWVEVTARPTARDFIAAQKAAEGDVGVIGLFIKGWSIKVGGEDFEYSQDAVLDLPLDILTAITEAVEKNPLLRRLQLPGTPAATSAPPSQRSRRAKAN